MSRHVLLMMTVLTGAFLLLTPTCEAADQKIGVVRFGKLISGYQRMIEEQQANILTRDELVKEQNARRDEINRLGAKLQQHTPESEAYAKTQSEIRTKTAELETWAKVKSQELVEDEGRIIRGIYEDVEGAAGTFAKKNGYTLIFKEDDLDLANSRMAELKIKVALKKILYFDPSVDITDDLLKTLNKTYKASRK